MFSRVSKQTNLQFLLVFLHFIHNYALIPLPAFASDRISIVVELLYAHNYFNTKLTKYWKINKGSNDQ